MTVTKRRGKLVVISGPAGVGKSTIAKEAVKRSGALLSVSVTTRKARSGEADGKDYRFVDRKEFDRLVAAGELLEWADVFGNCYGTPAGPVNQAIATGKTMVLEIDVQGGLQVHKKMPQATLVFVLPPREEELGKRLRHRGSEDEDSLKRRLAKAAKEIAIARESGAYNHFVVNDSLEEAIRQVVEILKA